MLSSVVDIVIIMVFNATFNNISVILVVDNNLFNNIKFTDTVKECVLFIVTLLDKIRKKAI
jgi:hypothetical protein